MSGKPAQNVGQAMPGTIAMQVALPDAYGQPISEQRQTELQGHLSRRQVEAVTQKGYGDCQGTFDNGLGKEDASRSPEPMLWRSLSGRPYGRARSTTV
jgi:hypothetical protein